jgi:Kelch motif/Galactose oxidase, central domain
VDIDVRATARFAFCRMLSARIEKGPLLPVLLALDIVLTLSACDLSFLNPNPVVPGISPLPVGPFSSGGTMTVPRHGHLATLLPDGRVLIVGGAAQGPANSAELYNPDSSTFAQTNAASAINQPMTATLLSNGKVLVTGAATSGRGSDCELYDPKTGKFAKAARMNVDRTLPTATALDSGRVLFAGGLSGTTALASAELYDPAHDAFYLTGSMATTRFEQTATLLADGRVLVAGGSNGAGPLASAELYDPSKGTFVPTGSMSYARAGHSAALLRDGTVLIVGGRGPTDFVSVGEIYDPETGKFQTIGEVMQPAPSFQTVTPLPAGDVLIVGVAHQQRYWLTRAELYNPYTGIFSRLPYGTTARAGHTATLLTNGEVLIAGGGDGQVLATVDLYRP